MRPIIKVENLSKHYFLGGPTTAYSTIRETLMDLARRPLQSIKRNNNGQSIWALKDLNFEIGEGEVVGIIGRNGAGKSTLLKILSRITEPTTGKIELYGRVASLLEVGTGFHPELSGRENIYLNGSMLGMTHKEIEQKFDEIVEFAEIEKFLDTPVKRYSSGMYVRLAFAVAAHLEPEILIIDEVLAVGDHAFQQKCLNKMQDVSKTGRTILFVSHNIGAVSRLCQKCILLEKGKIISSGNVSTVIEAYIRGGAAEKPEYLQPAAPGKDISLRRVSLMSDEDELRQEVGYDDVVRFAIEYEVNKRVRGVSVGLALFTMDGTCAFVSSDLDTQPDYAMGREVGYYQAIIEVPERWLNIGRYSVVVTIAGAAHSGQVYDNVEVLTFRVVDTGTPGSKFGIERKGVLQPILHWATTVLNK